VFALKTLSDLEAGARDSAVAALPATLPVLDSDGRRDMLGAAVERPAL